jgi:hypothetical protein
MQFAIMKWVAQTAMPETIYGIVDKSNPAQLPTISPNGHWEDFRVIDETRFRFADQAKTAITTTGYYLIGGSLTVTEIFGPPHDCANRTGAT